MKKELMKKIKTGEIKMKPKWWFEAIDLSEKSGFWVIAGLAGVAGVVVVLFWELYNPKELAEFGEVGRELIIKDFPYMWLFFGIISLAAAAVLQAQIGENYKQKRSRIGLITAALVMVITIVLLILKKIFGID